VSINAVSGIAEVRATAARIGGLVRRTPLSPAAPAREHRITPADYC
jgi:hypothetical protein